MKKISSYLVAATCLISSIGSFANSKTLANFDELLNALDSGKTVRAVIHMDKCTLESGSGFPQALSGGFTFDVYNHYQLPIDANTSKEVISTSKTVFSITTISNLGAIKNYIRLHVFKDNTARFLGVIIDPKTNEQKMSSSLLCPVSDDINQAGVMLYKRD